MIAGAAATVCSLLIKFFELIPYQHVCPSSKHLEYLNLLSNGGPSSSWFNVKLTDRQAAAVGLYNLLHEFLLLYNPT